MKLKSLPGFVIAVMHEEFISALALVADMYDSELKPIQQISPDGATTQLYVMRQSVALTAIAMGALDITLPVFILKDKTNHFGAREGYLTFEIKVHPEYGTLEYGEAAFIGFVSTDVIAGKVHYRDCEGTTYVLLAREEELAA